MSDLRTNQSGLWWLLTISTHSQEHVQDNFPSSEFEAWFIQLEVDRYRILVSLFIFRIV
jgi:hypothetical protein